MSHQLKLKLSEQEAWGFAQLVKRLTTRDMGPNGLKLVTSAITGSPALNSAASRGYLLPKMIRCFGYTGNVESYSPNGMIRSIHARRT